MFETVNTYQPRKDLPLTDDEVQKLLKIIGELEPPNAAIVSREPHPEKADATAEGQKVAKQLSLHTDKPIRVQPIKRDGSWLATVRYRTATPGKTTTDKE